MYERNKRQKAEQHLEGNSVNTEPPPHDCVYNTLKVCVWGEATLGQDLFVLQLLVVNIFKRAK